MKPAAEEMSRTLLVRVAAAVWRAGRLFLRTALLIFRTVLAGARALWRRVRYLVDLGRKRGPVWTAMAVLKRIPLMPFAIIEGAYFYLCRLSNLTRAKSYSAAIFYRTAGHPLALRNFIFDLDQRHRFDDEIRRTGNLEVIVTGDGIEQGSFFSAAIQFPKVRDVHVYRDEANLARDLPFFIPAPHRAAMPANWLVDIDAEPEEKIRKWFETGEPIDLEQLQGSPLRTLTQVRLLFGNPSVVALNLPSASNVFAGLKSQWEAFFAAVTAGPKPPLFLAFNVFDCVPGADQSLEQFPVIPLSRWGLTASEMLSLVRELDAYIGAFDEFGLMTVNTRVPALLTNAKPGMAHSEHPRLIRSAGGRQVLALDPLTAVQMAEQYRALSEEFHFSDPTRRS